MWKSFSRDSLKNLGQRLRGARKAPEPELKIPTPGATGGAAPQTPSSSRISIYVNQWKDQNLTWDNFSAHAKTYLPIITRAGYKAITEPAQKIGQQSTQKAQEFAKESSRQVSSYAQQASSQAKTVASQMAKQGKETIIEEAHTMKKDLLRWFWWWSLAAIFVYGLATTIPGEILKHYYKNRNVEGKKNTRQVKQNETEQEEGEGAIVAVKSKPRDNYFSSIFSWPFTSSRNNTQDETNTDNQNIFRRSNPFSQLNWPTWNKKSQDKDGNQKNDEEDTGILSKTKRLFPLSWPAAEGGEKEASALTKSKDYMRTKWSAWTGSSSSE